MSEIPFHVMGRRAVAVSPSHTWELEQRHRHGARHCAREQRLSPESPHLLHSLPQQRTLGTSPRAGQGAQERLGLWRSTTADFNAKHHQTSAPWMTKVLSFWRRVADKPAPSSLALRASLTMVVPPNRGNPSTTTSSLRASATFGSARSRSRTMTFVVTLPPASRQIRTVTVSSACPKATPAEARGQGKREMEATQDNTKQLWRDPCDATCGARGEGETSATSALGAYYKRLAGISQSAQHVLVSETLVNT